MVSQYKQGQHTDASWNFTIDGQYSFIYVHYNQKNKKWKVINNNATGVLENWENNAELAQDLAMLSIGDSRYCLEEFLKHQKEMPRPTSRTPNFTQIASAMNTTQLPPIRQLRDNRESMAVAIPIILCVVAIVVVMGICICKYLKKKSHPQKGESSNYSFFSPVSRIWGNCGGQHTPSAMGEPHPENTTNMMVMYPLLGASPQCSLESSSGV
ncbi:retinoic acid early-inducible protein 1-epsilon-like [Mesocricetus auratus]|uniref:Retinoic acid early-inducible protein 1-epsilon-like n=1 Tax=Mesocricetus auratus TaxID=10036 RepID=A0ABM2W1K2_MESAU|nr:retinoic acid early-inducible protein 1-epsilon-like [Mesocricetus auratus]